MLKNKNIASKEKRKIYNLNKTLICESFLFNKKKIKNILN